MKKSDNQEVPLKLIQIDVGPISSVSNEGNKYIVTFIDDYSRYW